MLLNNNWLRARMPWCKCKINEKNENHGCVSVSVTLCVCLCRKFRVLIGSPETLSTNQSSRCALSTNHIASRAQPILIGREQNPYRLRVKSLLAESKILIGWEQILIGWEQIFIGWEQNTYRLRAKTLIGREQKHSPIISSLGGLPWRRMAVATTEYRCVCVRVCVYVCVSPV